MIRNFGASGITHQPAGLDLGFGGASIKKVQTGSTTLTATSKTVTITAVDTSKAIVFVTTHLTSPDTDNVTCVSAEITNSTTITLTRNTSLGTSDIAWTVVEFDNVKSMQKGTYTLSATSGTVTVTDVNVSKSFVVCSWTTTSNASSNLVFLKYYLSNSTTISFTQGSTSNKSVRWQLIEFN